jgi:AsmA protein
LKILLGLAGVVIVAAVLIAVFVNANTFRPAIEKQLTTVLGRKVKLGDLRFSIFTGDLVAKDLSVADDPSFSASPLLTAQELRFGVSLRPLIFSHQVNLRSLQVESPQINAIRATDGTWNFANIGPAAPTTNVDGSTQNPSHGVPGGATQELVNMSVGDISIENAHVVFTTAPGNVPPLVYEHVDLKASNFLFAAQFPFELSADLPGGGIIKINGRVGPINRHNAAGSPVDAQVSLKHLDPIAIGLLDPDADMSFLADIETHAAFDGESLSANGTAQMENLKLHKGGPAVSKPVNLVYTGALLLKDNTVHIDDLTVKIGDAAVHVKGIYKAVAPAANSPPLNLLVAGQNLPLEDLQPVITAAAIRLPNGSVLKGGTLAMNLVATGQSESLTISGPVALDNTRLVGFDVGSKIHGIAALSGLRTGDTTEFEKLHMKVRKTNASVVATDIDAVIPGMGELTGSGTVSPTDQLDFNLFVQVASAKGVGKIGVGLLTKLSGSGGSSGNGSGVPIHVTGTSDEPYITADVGGILKKKTKSIVSIFGKKK